MTNSEFEAREAFEKWAKTKKYSLISATVDGVFSYLNQKTHIAFEAWQEQQKAIDEQQKRVDKAIEKIKGNLMYVEQDKRGNFEFLQMTMIRSFKDLEQALRGGHES